MKRKDFGLIISLSTLLLMAIFSEKDVLITKDFQVPKSGLITGKMIYQNHCADCHERGTGGAPVPGKLRTWGNRLANGAENLVLRTVNGCSLSSPLKNESITGKEVEYAVAYMIRRTVRSP